MHTKQAIGIDLGGTNIRIALLSSSGEIMAVHKQPTHAEREIGQIIEAIASGIEILIDKHRVVRDEIVGVGLGAAGFLALDSGIIHSSPNLPTVHETPVVSLLARLTGLPVYLENDANAAVLGEHWMGAGRGSRNLLCITLGTGVGSGFILNDTIWHGSNDLAGELGHTALFPDGLPCTCGRKGCLEAYVSATGIVTRTLMALKSGRSSSLTGVLKQEHSQLSSLAVYEHGKKGDRLAREILEETGRLLGISLGNVLNMLDLETIILGGQVSRAAEFFLGPAVQEVERRAIRASYYPLKIVLAQLGDHAGIIGAAKTAFDQAGRA